MKPGEVSLPLLRALHEQVFGVARVRAAIDALFRELAAQLRARTEPPHAAAVIPIGLFARALPPESAAGVRLCRAFLLRRGARMAVPEVHSNSVQRLVSYSGSGWIHQEGAGGWSGGAPGEGPGVEPGARPDGMPPGSPGGLVPRALRSPGGLVSRALRSPGAADPFAEPLGRSWDIVPAGVWHFPEAGTDEDWATVTFHSASEEEIVDESWEGE